MAPEISIAIETSCRAGGVALGLGDELAEVAHFSTSQRHATQLITHLKALLADAKLHPRDLNQVYVSAGPGSFTGLRIGITAGRTLAQMVPNLQCVAVPTPGAVAENAQPLKWKHLGVVMAAKENQIHATFFVRRNHEIVSIQRPALMTIEEFLLQAPRPLLLIGEALGCYELAGEGIQIGDSSLHLPTVEGLWRVGRRMAKAVQFTEYHKLLPIYARRPEAVRLWEKQQGRRRERG